MTSTDPRPALFLWQADPDALDAGPVHAELGTLERRTLFLCDRFGTLRTHDGMPILALHGPAERFPRPTAPASTTTERTNVARDAAERAQQVYRDAPSPANRQAYERAVRVWNATR